MHDKLIADIRAYLRSWGSVEGPARGLLYRAVFALASALERERVLAEGLRVESGLCGDALRAIVSLGHTEHCAMRLASGDGECECGRQERIASMEKELAATKLAHEELSDLSRARFQKLLTLEQENSDLRRRLMRALHNGDRR